MRDFLLKYKELFIALIIITISISIRFINIPENKKQDNVKMSDIKSTEQITIENPDRIIFKDGTSYYKITSNNKNYESIINLIKHNTVYCNEYEIESNKINELKDKNNFIEFDYDKISKNNIFFFDGDINWVRMTKDIDGVVASQEIKTADAIYEIVKKSVKDEDKVTYDENIIKANNTYNYLPSKIDFEEIKANKVYKKEFSSYSEYKNIISRYGIEFDTNLNIEPKFKDRKIILFLSKYDISSYKVSIGNIRLYFSGEDLLVDDESQKYMPVLMILGTAINTNCIYYNYDNITTKDNLTGTKETLTGVVKKIVDNEFEIAYSKDEYNTIGIFKITYNTHINTYNKNGGFKEGDFVEVSGTVSGLSGDVKVYDATAIYVTSENDYNSGLLERLQGKTKINTCIEYNYKSEGGNSGYVYCSIYYGENSSVPDGYFKIYYDKNTESYLGMERHLQSNYGIVKHEIVDITLTEPIKDINNMKAKMFEYIAD